MFNTKDTLFCSKSLMWTVMGDNRAVQPFAGPYNFIHSVHKFRARQRALQPVYLKPKSGYMCFELFTLSSRYHHFSNGCSQAKRLDSECSLKVSSQRLSGLSRWVQTVAVLVLSENQCQWPLAFPSPSKKPYRNEPAFPELSKQLLEWINLFKLT